METMKKFEVTEGMVEIRQGDALKVKDLDKATVVMLYMLPEFMEKLGADRKKTSSPAPASWPTTSPSRTGSPTRSSSSRAPTASTPCTCGS